MMALNMQQPSRVKVEDALSYLDLVKTEFVDHPDVYNDFLDVMKDFKSQMIDTPGVISKVSGLFRGRPSLIVGFNTFLPAGFEVKIIDGLITISEPNGNVTVLPEERSCVNDNSTFSHQMDTGNSDDECIGETDSQLTDMHRREISEDKSKEVEVENEEEEEDAVHDIDSNQEIKRREKKDGQINFALNYVNRIKIRFADTPIVYKQFLAILNAYQEAVTEVVRYGSGAKRSDKHVLDSIGLLFRHHKDLLDDFQLFLPDLTSIGKRNGCEDISDEEMMKRMEEEMEGFIGFEDIVNPMRNTKPNGYMKKEDNRRGKKEEEARYLYHKDTICRRKMNVKEAIESMRNEDIIVFDSIRSQLTHSQYRTVMRHIELYSACISSRKDVLKSLSFLIPNHPIIYNRLSQLLRYSTTQHHQISQNPTALQIDYSSCKQNGISYRSLPEDTIRPKCSGRTPLCYEVLNETWVSFPSWASEDSQSVSSKKTQYEEFVYRTEDERFEMDIVMEGNRYAIRCLEDWKDKLNRMTESQIAKLKISDTFGVSSPSIFLRAIRRIYGESANKILDSFKTNPKDTVNTCLDSLLEKDRELEEALTVMNKTWREQGDKYLIRSLDHNSSQVKNYDSKYLRPKNLFIQLDNVQKEYSLRPLSFNGPHIIIHYPHDRRCITDATNLILHHIRRCAMSKEEKKRVRKVLTRFLLELFALCEGGLSDSEDNGQTNKGDDDDDVTKKKKRKRKNGKGLGEGIEDIDEKIITQKEGSSNTYRLIYGSNPLYTFLRMHHLLCDRLGKLRKICDHLWMEQKLDEKMKEDSTSWADAQRGINKLRGSPSHAPSFDHLISLVKQSLDGNLEPIAFEDEMRGMIPSNAFLTFSLDKIITGMTRQLQILSSADTDKCQTINLYTKYRMERAPYRYHSTVKRSEVEDEYEKEARSVMEGSTCVKIVIIDDYLPTITMEMLKDEEEDDDDEQHHLHNDKNVSSKVTNEEVNEKEKSMDALPSTNISQDSHINPQDCDHVGKEENDDEDFPHSNTYTVKFKTKNSHNFREKRIQIQQMRRKRCSTLFNSKKSSAADVV